MKPRDTNRTTRKVYFTFRLTKLNLIKINLIPLHTLLKNFTKTKEIPFTKKFIFVRTYIPTKITTYLHIAQRHLQNSDKQQ
jgi:hypothetical protein